MTEKTVEKEASDKSLAERVQDFDKRGHDGIAKDVAPPPSLIQLAIANKYEPEFISKMMDLQERTEARLAKQAYIRAMAKFKEDPPRIVKDKAVAFQPSGKPPVSYMYADLASALDEINTKLSPHGLFASWTTDQSPDMITVTCVISHELGHSESTKLSAAPDETGSKNKIQAMGSTVYYLSRYTLFALLGLAAHGEDTNGLPSEVEYIDKEQRIIIQNLITDLKVNEAKFIKFIGVESVDKIPKKDFDRAEKELKRKEK